MQGNGTHIGKLTKMGPLPDGSYRYFSHLTKSYSFDDGDGAQTYVGRTGMDMSAFVSSADLGVDNYESTTLPSVDGYPLEGYTLEQVKSGELDAVPFVTYFFCYTNPGLGKGIFAGGTIGEQRIKGTALINLENRSITNKFKQNIVEQDSVLCRAPFGSQALGTIGAEVTAKYPCTYDYTSDWVAFSIDSVHPTDVDLTFYTDDFAHATGYFRKGMVRMLTGANAGHSREVSINTLDTGVQEVTMLFPFPHANAATDTGEIRWGCDKTTTAETGCPRFFPDDWNLRFRGEAAMPTADANINLGGGAGIPGDTGGTGENPVGNPIPPPPLPPGGAGTPGTPTARSIGADSVDVVAHGFSTAASAATNTAAWNAAIAALAVGGGEVYSSVPGIYNVTVGNTSGLIVLDRDNTRLNFDGVKLKAAHSTTVTAPATHRDVVRVDGADEWEITGGEIEGYLDTWVAGGGASVYGISEWAHGIYVTNSATNGSIYSITCNKCVGDGVSLGRSASDIYIGDYAASTNRRQGISSGASNVLIENFDISYTGTVAPPANGPWAGIDIEVDSPNTASNITIRDGRVHHNKGPGILAVVRTSNITISGVTSDYNQNYGMLFSNSDTGSVKGCSLEHNKYHGTKFENDSDGWTVGGATSGSADKNRYFNNNTATVGVKASGTTSQLQGESEATKHHINTEDGSAVTVLYNDIGP